MALTIDSETNFTIDSEVQNELAVPVRAGRKGCSIQLQDDGFLWIALSNISTKDNGFRVRGWEIVDLSVGFKRQTGNGTDFFEGAVLCYWEPRGDDPPATTTVRVIEVS